MNKTFSLSVILGAVAGQINIPPYTNNKCTTPSTSTIAYGLIPDTELGGCKCEDVNAVWAKAPFSGTFESDGGPKWSDKGFKAGEDMWSCYCKTQLMYSSYPVEESDINV
jgi:hypothetical protein